METLLGDVAGSMSERESKRDFYFHRNPWVGILHSFFELGLTASFCPCIAELIPLYGGYLFMKYYKQKCMGYSE